jgi:hypothetical protein
MKAPKLRQRGAISRWDLIGMFTAGRRIADIIESSRDSSLVANGPPAPGRLHFEGRLPGALDSPA